jgi:hypothetical protein
MPTNVCTALTFISKGFGIEYKEPGFRIDVARLT